MFSRFAAIQTILCTLSCVAVASRTPVYNITPHLLELELELHSPRVVVFPLTDRVPAPEPLDLTPDSACVWCSGYDHYPRFAPAQSPGGWRVQLSPVPLWVCRAGVYDAKVVWSNRTDGYVLWHFRNQTLCGEGVNPISREQLQQWDDIRDQREEGDRLETVFLEYAVVPLISLYLLTLCGCRHYKSRKRHSSSRSGEYAEIYHDGDTA